MTGLYSYNLLDHPDFLRAQKIEKRIIRYNMKAAEKDAINKTKRPAHSGHLVNAFATGKTK